MDDIQKLHNPALREVVAGFAKDGLKSTQNGSISYIRQLQTQAYKPEVQKVSLDDLLDRKTPSDTEHDYVRKSVSFDAMDKSIIEAATSFIKSVEENSQDNDIETLIGERPDDKYVEEVLQMSIVSERKETNEDLMDTIANDPLFSFLSYCKYDTSIPGYDVKDNSRDYFVDSSSMEV